MPEDSAWDWPLLLYTGTVLLRMDERKFWRTSPRKLNSLFKVHIELNSSGDKKKDEQVGYIDQIF